MCISYFSNLSFSWCSFKYNFVHQPIEFFGDNWFFIHMKMHRENITPPPPRRWYIQWRIVYTSQIYVFSLWIMFNQIYLLVIFIYWLWIFLGVLYFQYRYFSSNYGENHPCQQASHPGLSVYIYTSTLYSIPSIQMTMLVLRKRTIKDYIKEKIYIPVHSRMRKKKKW